jgi:hypothetical protein
VWRENRKKLLALPFNNKALIYLEGNTTRYRNAKVEYLFRQESNFMYCPLNGVHYATLLFNFSCVIVIAIV